MEIDTKQLRLAALAYDGQDTTGQSLAKTLICIADYIDRLKEELEDSKRYGTSKFIECSEWIEKVQDLQYQLAEARAENKRLKDNLSDAYDDHCDSH